MEMLDSTELMYTWVPAGTSKSNTFTAQNIFVSPTTTTAAAVFQANGTISANPAGYANCAFQSVGAQATTANNMFDSAGGVVQLVFRRRNGTYSAQTAVLNNQTIAQLDWQGHDGTTVRTQAQILGFAVENFTSTANGTAMTFATTPAGTTTLTTRLTLGATANFAVGVTTIESAIDRAAGLNRFLFFRTSASNRWAVYAGSGAESGSNAGSDFGFERYSDAGASLGLVMLVTRSTGNITFNGGGGKTTFSANAINISTAQSPASNGTGTTGDVAWDTSYLYICTATNTWKRVALTGGY